MKSRVRLPILIITFLAKSLLIYSQDYYQIGNGEKKRWLDTLRDIGPSSGGYLVLKDTVYIPSLVTPLGLPSTTPTTQYSLIHSALVIGFLQQPMRESIITHINHRSSVSLKIIYKKIGWPDATRDSIRISLSLDFNKEKGTDYKAKEYFMMDSVVWAAITIDTFKSYTPIPFNNLSKQLMVSMQIRGLESTISNSTSSNPTLSVERSDKYIKLKILNNTWASSYDLEWRFVDGYSDEPLTFNKHATRINIKNEEYKIPIVSSKAKFIARVRGRSPLYNNTDFVGPWSSSTPHITIDGDLVFEKDKKPWQYQVNYAEDGLRSEGVSFYDGTGRDRQAITKSNTEGQHLIVAEKYYDFQGRPVITSLLTPFKPITENNLSVNGSTPSSKYDKRSKPKSSLGSLTKSDIKDLFKPSLPSRFIPSHINLDSSTLSSLPISIRGILPLNGPSRPLPNTPNLENPLGGRGGNLPTIQPPAGLDPTKLPTFPWFDNKPNPGKAPSIPRDCTYYTPSPTMPPLITYIENTPGLDYIPSFNTNESGAQYSAKDFDLDVSPDQLLAKPMSKRSGSGRYYSPENDVQQLHLADIPDAEGYPFVQAEYTPDNTGRVLRTGMAGKDYQIGAGHEVSTIYGIPSKEELYRLFGNEVGDEKHYMKILQKNPDNQYTVKYVNTKGQTIASGIAGRTPDNLRGLVDNENDITSNYNLSSPDDINLIEGKTYVSSNITIDKPLSNLNLHYELSPQQVNTMLCRQTICYDCPKSIIIQVKNEKGTLLIDKKFSIGLSPDPNLINCDPSNGIVFDTTLQRLNEGAYTISKSVVIDQDAKEAYINDFVSRDTACFNPNIALPQPCRPLVCIPCKYELATPPIISETYIKDEKNNWKRVAKGDPGKDKLPMFPLRVPGNNPSCARICDYKTGDSNAEIDMESFGLMVKDLLPGGIYACYEGCQNDTAFVSIFSPGSIYGAVPAYRLMPPFAYKELNGKDTSWVNVTATDMILSPPSGQIKIIDGKIYTIPQNITNLNLLIRNWKETWSELLVMFHPEFVKMGFQHEYQSLRKSIKYDRTMLYTDSFDEAITNGLFNADGNVEINSDPIATTRLGETSTVFGSELSADIASALRLKLNNYLPLGNGQYLNLYESLIAQVKCNGPYYMAPNATGFSEIKDCVNEHIDNIRNFDDTTKAYIWTSYKMIYRGLKQKIIDSIRNKVTTDFIRSSGMNLFYRQLYLMSRCIGVKDLTTCGPCAQVDPHLVGVINYYYAKYDPIFPHLNCQGFVNFRRLADKQRVRLGNSCGKTPESLSLLAIFYSLASNPTFSLFTASNVDLNSTPPLTLGFDLAKGFPNPHAKNYFWNARLKNDILIVTIKDESGASQTTLTFTKRSNRTQWPDIKYFSCMDRHLSLSKDYINEFMIKVVDGHGNKDTIYMKLEDPFFDLINFNRNSSVPSFETNNEINYNILAARFERSATNPTDTIEALAACCIEYVTPPIVALSALDGCRRANEEIYATQILTAKINRAIYVRDSMNIAYARTCLSSPESFTAQVEVSSYSFTLFYYDQVGNLYKTLPPLAVVTGDLSLNRPPNHKEALATRYINNSRNQPISIISPDAGTTRNVYDEIGRPVITQDAVQVSTTTGKPSSASYIKYDAIGRIQESGAFSPQNNAAALINTFIERGIARYDRALAIINTATKSDHTVFEYDIPTTELSPLTKFKTRKQENLRNRLSSIKSYHKESSSPELEHAMYFTYDIVGNAKEVVQDIAALHYLSGLREPALHRYKSIRYRYDQLSGKMKQISFQEDQPDQFYRWYSYDADGRVLAVKSGSCKWEPEIDKDIDARYEYYKHGPISRMSLGSENIQAVDMAYTINGLLKNVNNTMAPDNEDTYLPDVLNLSMHYYDGDYKKIRGVQAPKVFPTKPQYAGNISAITMQNAGLGDIGLHTHRYEYDQLYRLVSSRTDNGDTYSMNVSYDRNGNIRSMDRADKLGNFFDRLSYTYDPSQGKRNQLRHISDGATTRLDGNKDLASQNANNYSYDAKGRLTSDQSENNMQMVWSYLDKLRMVSKGDATNLSLSIFNYDVYGRRTLKQTRGSQNNPTELTVRDMAGNVMAEYQIKGDSVWLTGIPIYAESRIGQVNTKKYIGNRKDTIWSQYRGHKLYELKNQIGDINALVSDRRLTDELGNVSYDIYKATEYYPFGMVMPERDSASIAYHYGFQGMEKDDNLKGAGNSISTEFRQYDPRVGRWLSVDPLLFIFSNITPFNSFVNNPIIFTDPKGDCPWCFGAAVGFGAGVVGELINYSISGKTPDPLAVASRLLISTGAGAATMGLSSIESVGFGVVVSGSARTGINLAATVAIDLEANAIQQLISITAEEQKEFSGTQLAFAGALSISGSGIQARAEAQHMKNMQAKGEEILQDILERRASSEAGRRAYRSGGRQLRRYQERTNQIYDEQLANTTKNLKNLLPISGTLPASINIGTNSAQAATFAESPTTGNVHVPYAFSVHNSTGKISIRYFDETTPKFTDRQLMMMAYKIVGDKEFEDNFGNKYSYSRSGDRIRH